MRLLARTTLIGLVCLLVSVALGSATACAADATSAKSSSPAPTFDLSFAGGSLGDLISDMASKQGLVLNVVGSSADLAGAKLPAFTVRNIQVNDVLILTAKLLEKSGYTLSLINPHLGVLTRTETAPPTILFVSFEIAPYLGARSVDDIIDAIHVAWSMDDRVDPKTMKIKYHPPTGLILMSGPIEGIDIAKRVTGSLEVNAKDQKN